MKYNNNKRSSRRSVKRGGFRRRSTSGRKRNNKASVFSDISKFINKATPAEEVAAFVPEHTFSDFDINPLLKANILAKGYKNPTPIQDQSIHHILRSEDIVGIANTGTGKTAAFLIPLINKTLKDKQEKVLIMTPTRELAHQIDEELQAFAKKSGIISVVLIGGANMRAQIRRLSRRHNFVVGTPGRIKDHIQSGNLDLGGFKTVVLDEADRMLDMGFIHDMRFMMERMPRKRHTLFFSATLSSEIEKLIGEFLRQPARVSVKTQDTSKNIDQDVVRIKGKDKLEVLKDLLVKKEFDKTLVFSRTKFGTEKLAKALKGDGIKASSIHGNKSQRARLQALSEFKRGDISVLVATDVAARGLDISDVSHVINYDLPSTYEDYIHRIGRTGRADKKGKALTFVE